MATHIFTVGWEPHFSNELLAPIEGIANITFTHGLVGDSNRIAYAKRLFPHSRFVALSKSRDESLPNPDIDLLASLEGPGIPTVRSMIQGDRVLRHRAECDVLGYATLLAQRIRSALTDHVPDIVLASHDSLHAAMSLAVARAMNIPWVAMAFPVIPDDLTGFCNALTPNSLLPIFRPVDETIRATAREHIQKVKTRTQRVVAYRPPTSLDQLLRQYVLHSRNLLERRRSAGFLGIDEFLYPSTWERMLDLVRRGLNRVSLPTKRMLTSPPESKFVYYPFHMAPESMVDTWAPFYQNQLAFVAQVALAIPADFIFVAKLHFSDPDNYSRNQLEGLMKMPRVRIAHPNASGSAFIQAADLVLGIQGTSCLEGALLGKPVLIFGDSPYLNFPRSERAKEPDQLGVQIRRMLQQSPPTQSDIEEAYAAYIARYMPGRVNDWTQPLDDEHIKKYANCFESLAGYVAIPQNRESWYKQTPFYH